MPRHQLSRACTHLHARCLAPTIIHIFFRLCTYTHIRTRTLTIMPGLATLTHLRSHTSGTRLPRHSSGTCTTPARIHICMSKLSRLLPLCHAPLLPHHSHCSFNFLFAPWHQFVDAVTVRHTAPHFLVSFSAYIYIATPTLFLSLAQYAVAAVSHCIASYRIISHHIASRHMLISVSTRWRRLGSGIIG